MLDDRIPYDTFTANLAEDGLLGELNPERDEEDII